MKTNTMIQYGFLAISIFFAITLASCGEKNSNQDAKDSTQQEKVQEKEHTVDLADASFSDEMTGKVFYNYQQVRMALVNSDAEGVQTAAGNLADSFSEERDNMKLTALAMAEANELEKQRDLFSKFTEKVELLFKESIVEGAIFKQFCPMAFDGNGGNWISDLDEIKNPYYGKRMLKCGKVVEQIQ